jgi:4-amino-4-deoxy-L-arabinose transferase-like glycosyltransferase
MTRLLRRWSRPRGDVWLGAILLLALAVRTYHVAYPPWDYHNWRQTQTLMLARHFAQHGFDLLHPQVHWVGSGGASNPSYFSGEFSIESILAGLLYRIFGESEIAARAVVIAFSLLGIYFLYKLLERRAGPLAACMGAFLYALLPYHWFFGRVFMPDVPAISLALGGLLFLDRWTGDRKPGTLIASAVLTSLAILQKLTVVVVCLPALYLFWLAKGRRIFVQGEIYFFAVIALGPSIAWYLHAAALGHHSGFAFVQPGVFGHNVGSWLNMDFLRRLLAPLASEAFAPAGLLLFLLGLFWPVRNPAFSIFRFWTVGAALLLLLIPDLLSANYYYYSLLLPPAAGLGGLVLAKMASARAAYPLLGLVLVLFTIEAARAVLPLYQEDRAPRDLGLLLNRLTVPSDLIAGETGGSPNLLYFADRRGWMVAGHYELAFVKNLEKAGAHYFVDPSTADLAQNPEFFRLMDANFERLSSDEGPWPIYRLNRERAAIEKLPDGIKPLHINFGNRVELLGVSLRRLTDSPTSFDLVYFWRPPESAAADLRFVLDVQNAEGKLMTQMVYRPRLGQGPILRGESIVVLPASLPRAECLICAGWRDEHRQKRLAVIGTNLQTTWNCAAIAEIEILQTPFYGWFRAS